MLVVALVKFRKGWLLAQRSELASGVVGNIVKEDTQQLVSQVSNFRVLRACSSIPAGAVFLKAVHGRHVWVRPRTLN